jgi:hypothetical protein
VRGIEGVGGADVQRAARTYVQPDEMTVVVVGDRIAIEPGIRKLDLGPTHALTLNDVFSR